jgi:hypothetical protein
MMKFEDLVKSFSNGSPLTSMTEAGYQEVARQRAATQAYRANLLEAARLVRNVLSGSRWAALKFREALTTSDFPSLFGDILDRQILANYAEQKYTWPLYCKRGTIQDFRVAKRFRVDRGGGVLDGPIVAAGTAPGYQTGGSGTGI